MVKTFLRVGVFSLQLILTSFVSAQDLDRNYFPGMILGISGGYFNSFIDDFEKENLKEPIFGGFASFELFDHHKGDRAVYGVVRYQRFFAKKVGAQLIKWQQQYLNFGLRYKTLHTFMSRPTALLWAGMGLSWLRLSRTDVIIVEQIRFENNRPTKVTIDKSIVDKWGSRSFFFEVGQNIPLPTDLFPKFGIGWNLKYDFGQDDEMDLGSLSVTIGFYFSGLY